MQTKTSFKFLGATLACLMLSACGGGAATSALPGGGSSSSNGTGNGNNNSEWRVGTGTGVDFIPTKLSAGSNVSALFNGQTTTITANIVDTQGALITTSASVTFSSPCINAKTSSITGGNVVNSIGGVAKVEYQVGTCFGDDTVTASVNHNGTVSSASITLLKVNNKKIGTGTGNNFIAGQLSVSNTTLYEDDIAQITTNIVDNQNNLVTQPIQVIFHSDCIDNGTSTIVGGNVVTSSSGVVTAQYKVGKCSSDDVVTASTANGPANSQTTIQASATVPVDNRRIGSSFGQDFIEGALEIGVGSGALAPGGVTTITAYLVNSKGDLVTDAIPVTFASTCLSAGNASLSTTSNVAAPNNTITSVNGKAIAVYTSKGCAGSGGVDIITASASFKKLVLNASANLKVESDTAQTISFIDATPTLINIKGTGGLETSILKFQVLGQGGSPLKGICVNFSPSTTVGGLALVPSKCNPAGPETYGSTTDSNGYATTTIQAGTVATTVRVTAITSNGITTQSSQLAVTTGIPDQNSTSLSLSTHSPVAWRHDGVVSTATMRMADAFNNPVPIGTAVTFTTSGGSIDGSCVTKTNDGSCSVSWRSQDPRPAPIAGSPIFTLNSDNKYEMTCSNGAAECRQGRVMIVATAIGNESFIDGNGNGLYDDIEKDIFYNAHGVYNGASKGLPVTSSAACNKNTPISSASQDKVNSCDDLREAYVDKNFSSDRDSDEEIVDFNQNGIFDLTPNGKYDGALCSGAAKANGDCTSNKVSVRQQQVLVMASETPYYPMGLSNVTLSKANDIQTLYILLADEHGNGMPADTTVSVNTGNLKNATASVNLSGAIGESTEQRTIEVLVTSDEDVSKVPSGKVRLDITSSGVTHSYTFSVFASTPYPTTPAP